VVDWTAIDISDRMLAKSRAKTARKRGPALLNMDAESMGFKDHSFDTVVATCVFCSVPDPVASFSEIKRVLKPGGRFLMYEHMISRNPLPAFMLNVMNLIVSRIGPNINRDTMGNINKAGLRVIKEANMRFFDIFRRIDATP
jgi:ubiquinone/menaquinone biosynthesis C-methylase UbiE